MSGEDQKTGRINLKRRLNEFEGTFHAVGQDFICSYCKVRVDWKKKSNLERHLSSKTHLENYADLKNEDMARKTYKKVVPHTKTQESFNSDLCEWLVGANIPLTKLSDPGTKFFFEKYTSFEVPAESTIRKQYLPKLYERVLNEIREKIGDNYVWVSIDETTDSCGRYLAHVIVGILDENQCQECFLLTSEVLKKANNETIFDLFHDSLNLLWPDEILYDRVLLFVSDAAPYMIKAVENCKTICPKLVHVTCIAHGLHRVAEEIRVQYPDVNTWICNVKKVFLKAPERQAIFQACCPHLPLPPEPVITRWGTWINAAVYHADNFKTICSVIDSLNTKDARSIKDCQTISKKSNLFSDLLYIKNNFLCIVESIKALQTYGLPLSTSLAILNDTESTLKKQVSPVSIKIQNKFEKVFGKNEGLKVIKKISLAATDSSDTLPYTKEEWSKLKFAPLTSADVERSFSTLTNVLTPRRRSFTIASLRMYLTTNVNIKKMAKSGIDNTEEEKEDK